MWNEQHDSILQKEFGFYFSLDNGFHTHPTRWERQWRNTVCRDGRNAPHCILFLPVQCLSPFPANR